MTQTNYKIKIKDVSNKKYAIIFHLLDKYEDSYIQSVMLFSLQGSQINILQWILFWRPSSRTLRPSGSPKCYGGSCWWSTPPCNSLDSSTGPTITLRTGLHGFPICGHAHCPRRRVRLPRPHYRSRIQRVTKAEGGFIEFFILFYILFSCNQADNFIFECVREKLCFAKLPCEPCIHFYFFFLFFLVAISIL